MVFPSVRRVQRYQRPTCGIIFQICGARIRCDFPACSPAETERKRQKLAAIGSNCIDYYNNVDGGKAYPGGGPSIWRYGAVRLGRPGVSHRAVGSDEYGSIMRRGRGGKGVGCVPHTRESRAAPRVSQVQLIDGGARVRRLRRRRKTGPTTYLSEEDLAFIARARRGGVRSVGKVEGFFDRLQENGR